MRLSSRYQLFQRFMYKITVHVAPSTYFVSNNEFHAKIDLILVTKRHELLVQTSPVSFVAVFNAVSEARLGNALPFQS